MPRYLMPSLVAAALMATSLPAQQIPDEIPAPARTVQAAFQRAFNAGTPEAMRDFVRDHFTVGTGPAAERVVNYWMSVRLEVGALDLVAATREQRGSRLSDVFWYRGRTTGAYPGVELALDTGATPRIRGYGVNRALRPAVVSRPRAVAERALPAALDRYFRAAADSGHFSGSVVVARHGRTVFEGAYGPAEIATGRRNEVATPFRLASVTKLFTGVAIMQLVDRGDIALDDPVSKFIAEYPAEIARKVTVRHLLTHTSGIELDGDSVYMARVSATRSIRELLALQVERLPHLNNGRYADLGPLDHYDYTNEGIDLLAAIVERVSGQEWSAYLAEHVFGPAGMIHSGADFRTPVRGIPIGYSAITRAGNRRHERAPVPEVGGAVAAVRAAGSGYASARDMAAFFRALRDGTLLRAETARMMMTPHVDIPGPPGANLPCNRSYGFTMLITHCDDGATGVGHSGGTLGQSTVVEHFPESGYTLVILSNFDRVTWWAQTHVLEMLGLR